MKIAILSKRRLSLVFAPSKKLLSRARIDIKQMHPLRALSILNKIFSTKGRSIFCLKKLWKRRKKAPLWYNRSRFKLGNRVRRIIWKTSKSLQVIKRTSNIWWTGRKRSFSILLTWQRLQNKIDVLSQKFKAIWKTCHSPKCKTWTLMTIKTKNQAQNKKHNQARGRLRT